MLERLVNQFSSESGYEVDEIWSWEAANHGDSCLINKDVLGGICECFMSGVIMFAPVIFLRSRVSLI